MADTWTDEQLALVLASVGEHLVLIDEPAPEHGSPVPSSGAGSESWRRQGMAVAAAVVLVVALAVGALVAPVREAVADWLGLGSTRIEQTPDGRSDPAGLPSLDATLVPVTPAAAAAELGQPLPEIDTTLLGAPNLVALAPEGGVIMGWDQGETTLWVRRLGDPADVWMHKLASLDVRIEQVDGLGDAALSVEGDHVLATPDRRLAADTVVLWIDVGLEYRLESDLDLETMLDIARAVR
jgi:hypothetical protein